MQFFYRYPIGEIAVNFQQWRIYADTSEALRRSSSDVFGYRVDVPSRHSRQSVAGRRDARITSALSARLLPHRGEGASVFTCNLCKEGKKYHSDPLVKTPAKAHLRATSLSLVRLENLRWKGRTAEMRDSYRCLRGWHWWSVFENFVTSMISDSIVKGEGVEERKGSLFRLLGARTTRT